MISYFGDFAEDDTVNIPFNTFDSNDPSASVTMTDLADADIHVHKDGNTVEAVTDGASVLIDFDSGITGNHLITIDTSVDAFYTTGSEYQVRIEGTTVDAATINAFVGCFSIERAGGVLALLKATTLASIKAETALIVADTNELQTDDVPGLIATAQADLNTITDTDGVILGAAGVDLVWDEALTVGSHNVVNSSGRRLRTIQDGGSSYGGFIWIDTVNGTAGSTDYENGTSDNPVDTIADANTLSASVGLPRFKIAPGSTITFAATQDNEEFHGKNWTLALGGQSIAGSFFSGATITGIATGSDYHMDDCHVGTSTLADGDLDSCSLDGTLTMSAAATYRMHECYSGIAGSGSPTIDFGAAVGNTSLNVRLYSGGLTIDNKDGTGTDTMSLEGNGQLVVSASSGGAISVRGNFKVTNTGGATITYDDNTSNLVLALADTDILQQEWADGGRLDLIIDAILADTGTDGVAISATVANQLADAILNRDFTSVSDTNARTALNALRLLRNKYSIAGTTLTVTKENDSTSAWTSVLTTDAAADPVTASDPA